MDSRPGFHSNAAKSSKMEDRRNQEEIFRPAGNISNSVVATQHIFLEFLTRNLGKIFTILTCAYFHKGVGEPTTNYQGTHLESMVICFLNSMVMFFQAGVGSLKGCLYT